MLRHMLRKFEVFVRRRIFRKERKVPGDFTSEEIADYRWVKPFTMGQIEKIVATRQATEYVSGNRVPGDIVECGVWRGGHMMTAARVLLRLQDTSRRLILFDTFQGMSAPTPEDGFEAREKWQKMQRGTRNEWCFAPLDEVRANLRRTGYPEHRIVFVQGKVEDTLPQSAPETIALLRLDTDWHSSTLCGLNHLFPRLAFGGVLILDDYGHWRGCRQAVDEYLMHHDLKILLTRVDGDSRMGIKCACATTLGLPPMPN